MSKHILHDRSRCVADWKCGRLRYLGYEYDGKGLTSGTMALELYLGQAIHDGLAAIATGTYNRRDRFDMDLIATTAAQQVREALMAQSAGEDEVIAGAFAQEQAALVEGLLRGFYIHVWPRLMAQYPEIVLIEQECTYEHDNMIFMARPDVVLANTDGELTYVEYKSTSSKKEEWINSWSTAVQLHSSIRAIEATLGRKVESVIVQGLYKGYCLAPDTPVLTADLRWVPVEALEVGDRLAAFEEYPAMRKTRHSKSGECSRRRQWKSAVVTKTGGAILPCYRLSFDDGSTIVCSEHHKWLAGWRTDGSGAAKWVETKDLVPWENDFTKGHRILKIIEPKKTALGLDFRDNSDLGYLSAAFDGEGHLSQTKGKSGYWQTWVAFSQNPNVMLTKVTGLLDGYSIRYSERLKRSGAVNRQVQVSDRLDVMRLLSLTRPVRLLEKFNVDHLGGVMPCRPLPKLVGKEYVGLGAVITLETSTGTLIANGFASHNSSYGKQGSPMCYGYFRGGNPPFTQDSMLYEYKAGYKRYPTWEMEGGVKKWVESMPENILADQFPCTPPIFINDDLIDAFFTQRADREKQIDLAMQMLSMEEDEDVKRQILDCAFSQTFDQCSPAWGRGCPFRRICHGHIQNPLEEGWVYRTPHHAGELEAWEAESANS